MRFPPVVHVEEYVLKHGSRTHCRLNTHHAARRISAIFKKIEFNQYPTAQFIFVKRSGILVCTTHLITSVHTTYSVVPSVRATV